MADLAELRKRLRKLALAGIAAAPKGVLALLDALDAAEAGTLCQDGLVCRHALEADALKKKLAAAEAALGQAKDLRWGIRYRGVLVMAFAWRARAENTLAVALHETPGATPETMTLEPLALLRGEGPKEEMCQTCGGHHDVGNPCPGPTLGEGPEKETP